MGQRRTLGQLVFDERCYTPIQARLVRAVESASGRELARIDEQLRGHQPRRNQI
jgi:hypothetical protein